MDTLEKLPSLNAALLAMTKNISAEPQDVADEILMHCEYRITPEQFRQASKLLAKLRGRSIQEMMDSISSLCFWPIIVALVVFLTWNSWSISIGSGFGSLLGISVVRFFRPSQKLKKAMIELQEVFENPTQLYITRAGIGSISNYRVSLSPWRHYKGMANLGNYFFMIDRNGRQNVYPKSIFHSTEESSKFESLVTALIAGKPIDHLIQPDTAWPPKPTF